MVFKCQPARGGGGQREEGEKWGRGVARVCIVMADGKSGVTFRGEALKFFSRVAIKY